MGKKEIKIGQQIIHEDDLLFEVEYNGEIFTMQYPTPHMKALIETDIANRLGGYSRSAFSENHVFRVEATAYVNNLVVKEKSPDWFKNAWTCYDEDCILVLFNGYVEFRDKFQTRIRSGGPEGGSKKGKP